MLKEEYSDEIQKFLRVTKRLAENRFVTSSGGNAAWKLADDIVLITPTQMFKGDIAADDLVFINMSGDTVEGTRRPTGEKPMYLKFFQDRPDIQSVIHCHPPCACAAAILGDNQLLMRPYFPETTIEIGPVPVVPYAEPLTQELADNFAPYLQKYNSFIMENHGLVTMTREDIYCTMLLVEELESTVDSILRARSAGSLRELSRAAVRDLSKVMKTRSLPLMGAPGVNKSLEDLYY
ncbi:MAG TPA: class II aldolase/adducin family protein [Armatimonadota bacterium]|jgi:L-fuculose-phosphate aldolase